jgi:uncharacterized membrane protein
MVGIGTTSGVGGSSLFKWKYFILPLVYLLVDVLWIHLMTPVLYAPLVKKIQSSPLIPRMGYAIGAYIFLVMALLCICLPLKSYYKNRTGLRLSEPMAIFWSYGITGFLIYAIYNFTNAAIFKDYFNHVVLIDSIWGLLVFSFIGIIDSVVV